MSKPARADFHRFAAMRRFAALDGLRALSVIAVVWHHTSGTPGPAISGKGYLGVDFFFAISGFLITTLLVREHATKTVSLRKFYARRALRIFPLYYATLAVYVALVAATRRHTPEGIQFFHHLPAFVTYTSNWFVDLAQGNSVPFYFAWSLATEEQFYLLWPPVLVATLSITTGKRIWPSLAALAVLVVISRAFSVAADTAVLPWRIPASLALPILLGAAAALIVSRRRGFELVSPILGRAWSAPVAAVVLVLAIATNVAQPITVMLMVLVVVSVCLVERTPLAPVLQCRPMAFVGVISYGVYLLHMLSANIVRPVLHEQFGIRVFVATLGTVVVVAYLSFRFFETPLLKLKRRYESSGECDGDELSRMAAATSPSAAPVGNHPSAGRCD
ncbi:acyltransferase family protein [Mycobacterium sp.]|uniref:acyltransferase family protein n=1 Tax=Mycobacterium sp. TaxID=1785 RepID=UPI003CC67148